jgi:antitoxin component of MazEF toxin-antitoxin module
MSVQKAEEQDVRKLDRTGKSLSVTIPVAYLRKLGWRAKQKLRVTLRGKKVTVEDWKE